MLPLLRSIIDLPIVQDARPTVLGGADRLDSEVRWVHVIEQRDMTGLLQGGELVLSTGLNLGATVEEIGTYLAALETAGAVGLLVELLEGNQRTAADLRIAAGAVTMPVITVARRVRFVEITETVHRMIVADQFDKLQSARMAHEIFTTLSLESAGADIIVLRAAELIRASVVLEDLTHQVVAYSAQDQSAQELLVDWEGRSRSTHSHDHTARAGPEQWLQTPVGTRTQRSGRLIVPAATSDDDAVAMVLERASQALSINRLAERDKREMSHQAQAGLLQKLRQPHGLAAREAQAGAQALGLVPAPFYSPLVIRFHAAPDAAADALTPRPADSAVLQAVASALRSTGSSALTASLHPGSVGVLLAIPADIDEETRLDRFCRAVSAHPELSASRLTMGVGMSRPTIHDAAAGLDEALHVARTAATLIGLPRRFYRPADIRLRGLLAQLRDDPRAQMFAESELAGLLTDKNGDLELLRRFLASGGNKAALARTGFVSRPTLYARLAHLEERLGVDLADAESRTSLHVAVLLHDLRLIQ